MIIHLEELSEKTQVFAFEENPADFPALMEITESGECLFNHPLDIRLGARRMGDMVVVEGHFAVGVEMTCNRCLKQYMTELRSHFNLTYTRELTIEIESRDAGDTELQSEEIGLIVFESDFIDLRDALQSEIVMAVPMKPLCDGNCKGLCPKCGADLNRGDCGCKRKTIDPRFAVLKGLKIDN